MTICSLQLGPRFEHTKHGGIRGRVGGAEGDLNEKLFYSLNSGITEVEIFKAVYDIWRPSLSTEVPPSPEFTEPHYNLFPALSPHTSDAAELWSAEQLSQGGKHSSPAQQEWWCSKDTAWRYLPSCNAELKPKPTPKADEADSRSCHVI